MKNVDASEVLRFDGEKQIVFSESFNIYSNKLILKELNGLDLEINFHEGKPQGDSQTIQVTGKKDESNQKISLKVDVYESRQPLGAQSSVPIEFLKLNDETKIAMSLYYKSFSSDANSFFVHIDFYQYKA